MGFIIIYVTYKDLEEAEKIVKHLLKEKLIACANLFPIKSFYLWKGKIENNNEIVSILKSKKENLEKIKSEIKKIHSYKTPCIIKIDAEANNDFENWVNFEIKNKNKNGTFN